MKVQREIERKLQEEYSPEFLSVLNESHQHSVPPGSESHFRVELVSSLFEGMKSLERSRKVYATLASELAQGVHALSLKLFSPEEWAQRGQQAGDPSPNCHGGGKN